MIELTNEQLQKIKDQLEGPVQAINPHTNEIFILIPQNVYKVVQRVIDGPNRRGWDDPELDVYEQYRKKP